MSNRLIEIGRIPLVPDPEVALRIGSIVSEAMERTARVVRYKNDFFAPFSKLQDALGRYREILDRAHRMRELSMSASRDIAQHDRQHDRVREAFFTAYVPRSL